MKEYSNLPDLDLCKRKFHSYFPGIQETELDLLITSGHIKSFKKGVLVYSEGDRMKGCFFVYEGIVKIFQTGMEGKEQIIKFEKEGQLFGFRSVILKENACTSVETLTETILCFIPDMLLHELLKRNTDFAYTIMQIACKELGESNNSIKEINQKSVKKRLAGILTMLAEEFGTEDDGILKLNISREDLSNFAGTATETIIRLLSEYKTEGLVEVKGRKIRLLDINKLKRMYEE